MFLRRNVASQTFVVPGTLRLIADGSAVTTGASLTVLKDGTSSASAGTLAHISDGAYKYTPTQGETDCQLLGLVLSASGAVGIATTIRTTNSDPNDAQRLGLTALPSSGSLAVKPAVTLAPADVSGNLPADLQTIKTQAVTAAAAVTFPASIGTSTYAGGDTSGTTTLLGRITANVALAGTAPSWWGAAPTASVVAGAVWDMTRTGHATAGTFGEYIDAAISSRSTYAGGAITGITGVTFPTSVASQTVAPGWYTSPDNATLAGLLNAGKTAFTAPALANAPASSQSHAWTANATTVLSPAPTASGFRIDSGTMLGRVSVPGVCVLDSPGLNGYLARVVSYNAATGDVTLSAPLPTAPRTDAPFTVEFQSDLAPLPTTLASNGLDSITIETGLNARQALALIAAAEAGKVSGAEANAPVFKGAGVATTRITATCDAAGNRTAVTLSPPA